MTSLRVATFNVALTRHRRGALARELVSRSAQATAVAAIIRHVAPDVLLLNEFDHDPAGGALDCFQERYLAAGPGDGIPPISYAHRFTAPVNTGIPSGFDLDGDGRTDGPADALGFGRFPGQYGMALLSRYPIRQARARTFRYFPWTALPGAELPRTASGREWYPSALARRLPLSSKSHWDIPVETPAGMLHCLASHPTPPVFDGEEHRNRHRNRDEIRFWERYLEQDDRLLDDTGRAGGLERRAPFVILGDLNADPVDGAGDRAAIRGLLQHARVYDPVPTSAGAVHWHRGQHTPATGDPACLTGWFGCFGLRLDYVLPDRALAIGNSGVFWPAPHEHGAHWIGTPDRQTGSDHRLVWADLTLP